MKNPSNYSTKPKAADEIDKAMRSDAISQNGVVFHDVRKPPFRIYGLYNPEAEKDFKRLPDDVARKTNSGVASLYLNTAGGRVRFCTNSATVSIKAEMPIMGKMSHFALSGSCGFDLYIDEKNGDTHFSRGFKPPFHSECGFEASATFDTKKKRYFTLNFPTYSNIRNLYIGLDEGAFLGEGKKYLPVAPIVYYGSSITQGGCASRPGNTYESIVSQRMNIDHINLGFSGSGRGEDAISDYIASLKMSAFVMDYDHNSPSPEHLEETHHKMYSKIRKANRNIPIIMMSKSDFNCGYFMNAKRRNVIYSSYMQALNDGDRNVYFIDGESVFRGPYENICTVDGNHPNDMGFALMADAVEATLKKAFRQELDKKKVLFR